MPIFMCSKCGNIENTALSRFWHTELDAFQAKQPHKPLCSACDPEIGKWHGEFEQRSAAEFVVGKDGRFLYSKDEATKRAKHMGPFKPVVLPQVLDHQ